MHAAVIFATRHGNTEQVAQTIASALRARADIELFSVDDAPADLHAYDLVIVGGPTEGHGMTPQVRSYLGRIDAAQTNGRKFAAFDTRLAWPRMLSGSAADEIATDLREKGAVLAAEPESFIVSRTPELKPGELDRAHSWAQGLA